MRNCALLVALTLSVPLFSQSFRAERIPNPAGTGSVQPSWSVALDGSVVLSWIEPAANGSYALRYAVRRGSQWSEARTVASRAHFFRQPAETPEVIEVSDKLWMAHWVEMPRVQTAQLKK